MSAATDVKALRELAAWHSLHGKKRGSRSQEKQAAHHREAAALLLRTADMLIFYAQHKLPLPTIAISPVRELQIGIK